MGTDIHPGLVSISFRKIPAEELIPLVAEAGLEGIEWGGDVHVPHGDTVTARQVARWMSEAGLKTAAYGSYYRAAETGNSPDFQAVLDSATALEAPSIRVWAGAKGSADADESYRRRVTEDLLRISGLAAEADIRIALEYHGGTLTDTPESCAALLKDLPADQVDSLWQPAVGRTEAEWEDSLQSLLPRVSNLHVFHWGPSGFQDRKPLREGREIWSRFFSIARTAPASRWALLEFVKDDAVEQFQQDAAVLKQMVSANE